MHARVNERSCLITPSKRLMMIGMKHTHPQRHAPFNIGAYITTDPAVCHGKPCFKGTRIMVHQILELLEAGIPVKEIIGSDYYPQLTERHIAAALHYAGELLKTRSYAAHHPL